MLRSAEPRTWQKLADPVMRQALKEVVDRLAEVSQPRARGFLVHREQDLALGGTTTNFIPMDGLAWEGYADGQGSAPEYYVPEPGASNPSCWRPSKAGVPWWVFAGLRCNPAVGAYAQLELLDLNQNRWLRRLGEQTPSTAAVCQVGGGCLFIPEEGQQLSLRLDVGAWAGGSGVVAGRGADNLRSFFGAFCLQP